MVRSVSPNFQQLKAIKHPKGALLIVAGAGTGKTTVITERIKFLIHKKNIASHNILAVTFTDKAAAEMLERLDVVMPLGYEEPWLSTFQSFCDRLLKVEGLEIGLDPNYRILSPPEQWILIRKNLFDFQLSYYRPLGNPTKFISALLTFFSRAQDEDVSPEKLIKYAKNLSVPSAKLSALSGSKTHSEGKKIFREEKAKLLEVAQAYQTYTDLKRKESLLDFGDLITGTIELFKKRQNVLSKYQQQFKHILVDEFQDTNYAQYELLKLLAPATTNPNLIVVGDDDQSIYKFRGAAISNILEFKSDYPKAKTVVLTQNYRSTQPILTAAHSLIQNNNPDRLEIKLKLNKKLEPTRKSRATEKPHIISLSTEEEETEWVTQKILELTAREPYTYKDFAILARSNNQLDPFVSVFRRHGLPYQLVGNRGLFDRAEINFLIHFLKVVVDPTDSTSLFHLLSHPSLKFNAADILDLLRESRRHRTSLWHRLRQKSAAKNQKVVDLIEGFSRQVSSTSPTKILYSFLQRTDLLKELTQIPTLENELQIKNINLFLSLAKKFEAENPAPTVIEFVDYLELLLEAGDNPAQAEIEDVDTVRLITIHSAKGLEFPVVFIPGLITGRFPSVSRRDPIEFPERLIKETLPKGDEHLQEERRLLYVGLTRARDYLYLTWAKDVGGVRKRYPSGFLHETQLPSITPETSPQKSLLAIAPKTPLRITRLARGRIDLKFVSYSQIDTFKTCPLKYKYRYVLQVPAKPHHALTFGQSLHDTLRHFHQFELKGQKLGLQDLLSIYKHYFRSDGYESETHKKARFLAGRKALRQYFKVYQKKLGQPIELEKSFRLKIAGIPLIGRIDRIDKIAGEHEIVDYKTGASQDKKKVDVDEQLSIYALAARESLHLSLKSLSLYFLDSNEKVSTTRSNQDMDSTLTRLQTTIKAMKNSDFPPKPGYPFPCGFCEYNRICPFAAKRK
ncbi:MAG: UvrD-helicase domain-containing protein [Candidatus Chisholmbacteria bacterium]|nr:UvrD-helicase domain-containing protein [Candidatus Chisholmbacteria bacterium]